MGVKMQDNTAAVIIVAGAMVLEGIALILNRDGTMFAAIMALAGVVTGYIFKEPIANAICRPKK